MARKRIETGTTLQSWDEVDRCLAEIAAIDRELCLIETSQAEQIDAIRTASKAEADPLQAKKTGLELAIKDYAEANRAEFAKVKTKELTFGSVGFRRSTKINIKRVADTLQALKDLGLTSCIRITEAPDKEAMKNLDTETLANVGAALRQEDVFGYEVRREELAEVA